MKKGFTLIELLAVILILGIIALIAIPQVTNVIEQASKGAAETSAKHYLDAVNNRIALNQLDTDSSNDITSDKNVTQLAGLGVELSGEGPTEGTVYITNGVIDHADLTVNGYSIYCNSKLKCTVTPSE